MSDVLHIALLQLARPADSAEALAVGTDACRRAAAMGADLALFPELWQTGYSSYDPDQPGAREAWAAAAIGPDDPFLAHFRALARELRMAIAITVLAQSSAGPRNAVKLIDRSGTVVLEYAKTHTCDFDWECGLARGEGFPVTALDTAAGPVQIGAMICYDREFPEVARLLMLNGAEIVLVPNACPMEINRMAQLRTRAYENMIGVALANYAGPFCNGHSVAFDGQAFSRDESVRDMLLVEGGEGPGIFWASFDLAALRAYREYETWGNAFRRPALYGPLTDEAVQPPFVRPDARR